MNPRIALVAALVASGCSSEPAAAGHAGLCRSGLYWIEWTPVPDPIPANAPFELELRVTRAGDPAAGLDGAEIVVSGWMPDHGHGMSRHPRVEDRGDGLYVARGMLFHMRGDWELQIDVVHGGIASRAVFPVHLP